MGSRRRSALGRLLFDVAYVYCSRIIVTLIPLHSLSTDGGDSEEAYMRARHGGIQPWRRGLPAYNGGEEQKQSSVSWYTTQKPQSQSTTVIKMYVLLSCRSRAKDIDADSECTGSPERAAAEPHQPQFYGGHNTVWNATLSSKQHR